MKVNQPFSVDSWLQPELTRRLKEVAQLNKCGSFEFGCRLHFSFASAISPPKLVLCTCCQMKLVPIDSWSERLIDNYFQNYQVEYYWTPKSCYMKLYLNQFGNCFRICRWDLILFLISFFHCFWSTCLFQSNRKKFRFDSNKHQKNDLLICNESYLIHNGLTRRVSQNFVCESMWEPTRPSIWLWRWT